jgi:hypothetical protein
MVRDLGRAIVVLYAFSVWYLNSRFWLQKNISQTKGVHFRQYNRLNTE